MDRYDASNDLYCYPGTTVLKNKLDIRDSDALEDAEKDVTAYTIREVEYAPPPYDLAYMQRLHAKLFSPLFEWAGHLRSVDISKGGTRFCTNTRIAPESLKIFARLDEQGWLAGLEKKEFCFALAEHYCELNMIHPFREGNGRVQRLLFEHLALSAGYELDWEDVDRQEWIQANIEGVAVNYEAMARIFMRIVRVGG